MLMRTPRHPTPIGGEEKPKGNAKRILKNVGKGVKIVGKALGSLFVSGIIVTSFSTKAPAQGSLKAPEIDPSKNIGLTMASTGQPKNVYVVPMTDGKDTTASLAMNARAKTDGGEKKIEPNPPEQKWCDGIEIDGGNLIFKGVSAHEKHGDGSLDIGVFLKKLGLYGITTENIKWQEPKIINGEKKMYFVIETDTVSALMVFTPDFVTDSTWSKTIRIHEKIFHNDGQIMITDDGSVVGTTSNRIMIIQSGETGRKIVKTYDEVYEDDVCGLTDANTQLSSEKKGLFYFEPVAGLSKQEWKDAFRAIWTSRSLPVIPETELTRIRALGDMEILTLKVGGKLYFVERKSQRLDIYEVFIKVTDSTMMDNEQNKYKMIMSFDVTKHGVYEEKQSL